MVEMAPVQFRRLTGSILYFYADFHPLPGRGQSFVIYFDTGHYPDVYELQEEEQSLGLDRCMADSRDDPRFVPESNEKNNIQVLIFLAR